MSMKEVWSDEKKFKSFCWGTWGMLFIVSGFMLIGGSLSSDGLTGGKVFAFAFFNLMAAFAAWKLIPQARESIIKEREWRAKIIEDHKKQLSEMDELMKGRRGRKITIKRGIDSQQKKAEPKEKPFEERLKQFVNMSTSKGTISLNGHTREMTPEEKEQFDAEMAEFSKEMDEFGKDMNEFGKDMAKMGSDMGKMFSDFGLIIRNPL